MIAGIRRSRPPCVAVSIRKATYSHGNIVARKAFTVTCPPRNTSSRPTSSESTPERTLVAVSEIGIHTHSIGEIMDVKAEESLVDKDGLPDILKV